ncbi:glutamyl-tRNA reductase [Carboxylicivirga sediminis]|uniref:Glutamyl-tRNA reductase n=1 Tax=Carboxylicivirga sediminis TaxID=2006564 RepID=A0A941IZV9_9BACT|nr:glutamyl-tRNA reductase [Carboxylicivirga sediminis]MBR8538170.1 glutamyl-tRNA reductase [Carboxylicivirga sediminis]
MVGLIGISHQTALLEIREQLVITKEEVTGLYEYLNQKCDVDGIMALSTCNRTELYYETDCSKVEDMDEYVKSVTDAYIAYFKKNETIKKYLYSHVGLNCARHLFRVATGLDSLILGEYQIVSQLKEAFSWVDNTAMVGPELTRMVHKAFEAGKLVRTKTALNKGAVSVSSAAVELASNKLNGFPNVKALTVGAGETGTIVALNLSKKGCVNNWITNRTLGKAEQLADRVQGVAFPFESHIEQLLAVDVVTYATGSSRTLLTKEVLADVMQKRDNKPLLVLDLCSPRNVDADAGKLEGVTVYDLDHMEEVVKANFEKRKGKLQEAEEIIEEVLAEFDDWLNVRRMSSAISAITSTFKDVNSLEARNYKKVKDDVEASQKINEYGEHLSAKLTRMLIKQMKMVTNEGRDSEKVKILEEFFNFNS